MLFGPCVNELCILCLICEEPPTSGLGYTNIGDGVCTNGGWGSRLTPFDTVAYAVSWRHPVGASAPFTGNDCAQLCTKSVPPTPTVVLQLFS